LLQLLRKPSQTHIVIPYCTEDINKDEEDINDKLRHVNTAESLTAYEHEDSTNTIKHNIDFSKENDDLFLDYEPTQPGRSGKNYS
jgi:N-methylhydantoinase B/oxoprolinase/acetone carboxylase alpha subunit